MLPPFGGVEGSENRPIRNSTAICSKPGCRTVVDSKIRNGVPVCPICGNEVSLVKAPERRTKKRR